jgi:hypothetical protein
MAAFPTGSSFRLTTSADAAASGHRDGLFPIGLSQFGSGAIAL